MSNQQQQRRPGGQPFGPQGQQGPKKGPKFSLSWIYAIIAIALAFMWMKGGESTSGITRDITYSEFKQYIAKGYAEKVVAYDDNRVELTIIPDSAVHLFGQSTVQKGLSRELIRAFFFPLSTPKYTFRNPMTRFLRSVRLTPIDLFLIAI